MQKNNDSLGWTLVGDWNCGEIKFRWLLDCRLYHRQFYMGFMTLVTYVQCKGLTFRYIYYIIYILFYYIILIHSFGKNTQYKPKLMLKEIRVNTIKKILGKLF